MAKKKKNPLIQADVYVGDLNLSEGDDTANAHRARLKAHIESHLMAWIKAEVGYPTTYEKTSSTLPPVVCNDHNTPPRGGDGDGDDDDDV